MTKIVGPNLDTNPSDVCVGLITKWYTNFQKEYCSNGSDWI